MFPMWRLILLFTMISIMGKTKDTIKVNKNVTLMIDLGFSGLTTNVTTAVAHSALTTPIDL